LRKPATRRPRPLRPSDAAYPAHTAIKLILDNHSAHISKETKAWLADQPKHRFEFTFTPKHGSWLNLVEGFFSKLARCVLRHIGGGSKQELKDRIMAAMPAAACWGQSLSPRFWPVRVQSRLNTAFLRQKEIQVKTRAPAMSKEAMREEAAQLVDRKGRNARRRSPDRKAFRQRNAG
jgi:hypothetical protein